MERKEASPLWFFLGCLVVGLIGFGIWSLVTFWPIITGQHKRVLQINPDLPKTWAHDMILAEGGSFVVGSTLLSKNTERNEKPAHWVTIDPFYIGLYEVTFDEYDPFCTETGIPLPDDKGWGRGKRPAIHVTWVDAITYCNWLSEKEGLEPCYTLYGERSLCDFGKNGYRLPTETEWEFAAVGFQSSLKAKEARRRGEPAPTDYIYPGSNDVNEVAWFVLNSGEKTQPVGLLKPNSLGIYDMGGNVREWCWDIYDDYAYNYRYNPRGPEKGLFRVERGGRWDGVERDCRPKVRWWDPVLFKHDILGFRLARTAK
jgi:formylglycine-generating enzyme required for sulfatase activity